MRPSLIFLLSALTLTSHAQDISQNGKCGSDNNLSCQGSDFGDCCSQWGFCGRGTRYCGGGCDPAFGSCDGTTTIAAPAPSSTNARCGYANGAEEGASCLGSRDGDCCSQ
ncbi:carbohydrate-binding module family 18 protein [Plenodomus tracheiphilus IPT5]|uniref:Carbohydrate-binding module family 18 protein n=1 Tax=Plenodomus tracheiphilus IPT5 TaxID=1408161 RepID=A0A6A7BEZ1_9PLEO|nr:carbohydrate-binding module family 18 protein [Plenodomus tracheiphilus IPT5]